MRTIPSGVMRSGTALQLSPIARKQRELARFHGLGLTASGPPVGAGTGAGAEIGASQGASYGSVAGPIGAGIGAAIGAIGGAIAGSINKRDPEQANFDQAVAMWQGNRLSVLNLANKYLPLAGLFDLNLKGPHIPIYQRYGHMGEEKFVHDLALQVYQAAQNGTITATDTPQTVMVKVVQPWIDAWGFGPMNDPHQDLINLLLIGLIMDYVQGAGPQSWRARSGDLPASFSQIPPFSLPGGTVPAAPYAAGTAVAVAPINRITAPAPAGGVSQNVPAAPQVSPPMLVPSAPGIIPGSTVPVNPATPTPSSTTVPIPAGYTLTGIDAQSGQPVYQGLDSRLYGWNGTLMQPFTGTALINGSLVNAQAGVPQTPQSAPLQYAPPAPSYPSGAPQTMIPQDLTLTGTPAGGSAPSAAAPPGQAAGFSGVALLLLLGLGAGFLLQGGARERAGRTS